MRLSQNVRRKHLNLAMRSNEEIIKPFLLCCESKNSKLITLSLSSLHKLVSHSAVPDGGLSIIIDTLYRLHDQTEDQIQLKMLQLSLAILTSTQYDMNQTTLSKLLGICFILMENKVISVQQTGIVTLRQSISALFDKIQNQNDNCYLFFTDLCLFSHGKLGKWIKLTNVPSKMIVYELIEHILNSYSDIFSKKEFSDLLYEKVRPLSLQKSTDYLETFKIFQLSLCLLKKHLKIIQKDTLDILKNLKTDLNSPWKRVLMLELIRSLFEDQKFLETINTEFDYKQDNIFDLLLSVILDSIQKFYLEKFTYKINQIGKLIGFNHDVFYPTNEEILSLCLDSLNNLSKSIASIIGIKDIITFNVKKSYCSLVEASWSGVLACLKELLEKTNEDETLQVILRSYLLYSIISGVTDLSTPKDSFLLSLCKYTYPNDPNEVTLSQKNVQVLKVLFNIAHIIGEYLGSSWYVLLKNFQKLEVFLKPSFVESKELTAKTISEGNLSLNILSKDLSQLFNDTKNFKIEALSILFKQLINLSNDSNGNNNFADIRLFENIQINISRIEEFWDLISSHLVQICSNPNTCKFGIENLTQIISQSVNEKMTESLQIKLFSIYPLIYYKSEQSKKLIIQSFTFIIQKSGQLLTCSYDIILKILQDASQREQEINIAFKCVQLIGNDFLPFLSKYLSTYIDTVSCYTKQLKSEDMNTNLVAIGLFMTIGDYLQNSVFDNLNDLWLSLFTQLVGACIDLRYEVRNSAIKTLTFAIASQGKMLDKNGWKSCIQKVIIPILHQVHDQAKNAETNQGETDGMSGLNPSKSMKKMYVHHSRDTAAKQWSETRKLIIEGFSRVLTEHHSILSQLDSFKVLCKELIIFYENSVKTESAEIAQATSISLFEITQFEKETLWEKSFEIWMDIVSFASKKETTIEKQTLISIIEGFSEFYEKKLFDKKDITETVNLCSKLIMSPIATHGMISPSKIQEIILKYLSNIQSDQVFECLILCLPTPQMIQEKKTLPSLSFCLAIEKELLRYSNSHFEKLIVMIGNLLATRSLDIDYPLWKASVKTFSNLIISYESEVNEETWNIICKMIFEFLKFEKSSDEEEILLVKLVEIILKDKKCNDQVKNNFIDLLLQVSKLSPKTISNESIKSLFNIISNAEQGTERFKSSQILLPLLLNRCFEILETYLKDDKRSGNLPLPSYRRDEVLNIFSHIKIIEIHPKLFETVPTKINQPALNGKKGFVVRLFHVICEFIGSKEDKSFKNELLDLFRIVSQELGLN